MIIVFSLLFLGIGVALIVNTLMTPGAPAWEFPRQGVAPTRNRRFVPMAIGAIVALGGVVMLLVSRADLP